MMHKQPAWLVFADGTVFQGWALGCQGTVVGEIVFNTAMTGYQEIMTDPSYAGQLITFSYPHIGNTGINDNDHEASKVWAKGIIVYKAQRLARHWQTQYDLSQWLIQHNIVGIEGVDTRAIVHKLRDEGSATACIISDHIGHTQALNAINAHSGIKGTNWVVTVSTQNWYQWPAKGVNQQSNPCHIVVYDFGIKRHSLQMLAERGCHLTVVPADTSAAQVLALQPDGIFLSNGPGDPAACETVIDNIRELLATDIPIFGICMGHQLLALAAGARTYKMTFGHRGANHPVLDLASNQVVITSQNHGFAVDQASLPSALKPRFISLFDGSLQGFVHKTQPWLSIQGHPESSPGPHEWQRLFDEFISLTQKGGHYVQAN